MFLETEASFPYCNWSTKMAGFIWLGSTSVQHVNNWQRLSRLPFLSLCKSRKFLETKTYSFISIKKKIICKKKIQKNLVEIWFASVFAASSAASCSPFERIFVPHYVSCVIYHVSCVTCHLSRVSCHLSQVKFNFCFVNKKK